MAAELPIPVFTTLTDVHASLQIATEHGARWTHLAEEFERRFGLKPTIIARAPGRVNLIGEHIDYALFGVFPAAVERDILFACAPRKDDTSGDILAENLDGKYERQRFRAERDAEGAWHLGIDKGKLRWESYVKAGYYGVLEKFFQHSEPQPIGFDILVTGSVPAGSGLSSSAAMVVASTLSFLAINGKLEGMTKGQLVEMAMENEKRVGVNSGGMDQAASVISLAQSALYITFFPKLAAEPIPLPITEPSSVFVIANSLVVSDKVVGAKTRYNLRVVETLVAARVLARRLGVTVGPKEKITMRQVLDRWFGVPEGSGEELSVDKLKDGLENIMREIEGLKLVESSDVAEGVELGVTMEEMVEMTDLSEAEFKDLYLSWVDVEATHFQLYKRAKHVFSEAARVLAFRELCLKDANTSGSSQGSIEALGALMNVSQESCSELFECSCPELDELTRLCREAGAYGSRLTGAGWGGCIVSLVAESEVESFIQKVKSTYAPYKKLEGEALHEVIFATKPSSGACVYRLEV